MTSQRRYDTVDDTAHMIVILKYYSALNKLTTALNVYLLWSVDHYLADGVGYPAVFDEEAVFGNAGEIAVGKKADIVLLDLTKPQMNPPANLISSLAFSANGSEVDTVLVDGRVLLEKGRLTTIDEERVIYETNRIFERVNLQ